MDGIVYSHIYYGGGLLSDLVYLSCGLLGKSVSDSDIKMPLYFLANNKKAVDVNRQPAFYFLINSRKASFLASKSSRALSYSF